MRYFPPPLTLEPSSALLCRDGSLRHHAICAHCCASGQEALAAVKTHKTFEARAQILSMGERVLFLGTIVAGVVTVSQPLLDGRRQIVGLLFPGDLVGRPFSTASMFDYEAATTVRLCTLPRAKFEATIRDTPALDRRLLDKALEDLDLARAWMFVLGRSSAEERLCALLVLLARRALTSVGRRPVDGMLLVLPLSRNDVADIIGLRHETVSRAFNVLRKNGLVELLEARHVRIPDWQALVSATGGFLELA